MEQILRRELKTWQKAFKAQHGRDPTKRDILADDAIAGTYDTWMAVGGDAKAKPKKVEESRRSTTASSSKQRLDEAADRAKGDVFRTPSKRKAREAVETSSPSRNPYRTPSKRSSPSQLPGGTAATPGRTRNPFATPSKRSTADAAVDVSPARSMIEVEMTPTKRSPLPDTFARRNNFTPTKSPSSQQYVTASPSKLRTTVTAALRRTPTKTHAASDAALNQALVAYTPRTKARKRLRGEDVPPTPHREKRSAAHTDPRPVQKGLGAFGFASTRKHDTSSRTATAAASASVFSRARSTHSQRGPDSGRDDDEEMLGESPIKTVAKLRRASSKPGFKPLFASPSGNHATRDVLGTSTTRPPSSGTGQGGDDADAVMDDDAAGPVGGLFAAEVQQRRLRRARETSSEAGTKKHKVRPTPDLPASSDDEQQPTLSEAVYTSSPAYRGSLASSPNTELTVPSSTGRATNVTVNGKADASSPIRRRDAGAGVGWRKVQQVELSDDDEPRRGSAHSGKGTGARKVISITPYQRYGTLRQPSTSSPFPSSEPGHHDDDEEDEDDFAPYTIPTAQPQRVYAVDTTADNSDSDEDETHASLAGLQLSPVRHAPSAQKSKEQQRRLLNNLFDPSSRKKTANVFNPEARFGPLQPSSATTAIHNDDDEGEDDDSHSARQTFAGTAGSDDDDDWQQEVDEDFTFLDTEIELQDVA